jgi:hypothetical protein
MPHTVYQTSAVEWNMQDDLRFLLFPALQSLFIVLLAAQMANPASAPSLTNRCCTRESAPTHIGRVEERLLQRVQLLLPAECQLQHQLLHAVAVPLVKQAAGQQQLLRKAPEQLPCGAGGVLSVYASSHLHYKRGHSQQPTIRCQTVQQVWGDATSTMAPAAQRALRGTHTDKFSGTEPGQCVAERDVGMGPDNSDQDF